MGDRTAIEWTDATWNPVTGCSHVSEGCRHCYAEALSLRRGWSTKPWTARNAAENVVLHPERLTQPLLVASCVATNISCGQVALQQCQG
jgi:protein gp37